MDRRAVAAVALACVLAGCGSNAGMQRSLPAAPNAGPRIAVPLRVFIPNHIGSNRIGREHLTRRMRGALHQLFIAATTAGIELAVYPHGLRTGLVASLVGDASVTSKDCTHVADGRVCSYSLAIPPGGPYDFVFGTFDQAPSGGTIPGGAAKLGAALDTASIAAGKANVLKITVGGVVASTFVYAVHPVVLHSIASASELLTIGARDADGNLIASDGYVDTNGNALAITPVADSNAGKTITFTPATLSAPQTSGVLMRYSAVAATASQLETGISTIVSAKAGSAVAGTLPVTLHYPGILGLQTTAGGPEEIALAGGNAFVTDVGSDSITYTFNSGINSFLIGAGAAPNGITVDSEGYVWFAETGNDALGKGYSFSGSAGVGSAVVLLPTGAAPIRIGNGPDRAVWFSEYGTNSIGRVPVAGGVAGTPSHYPIPTAAAGPQSITAGPDGAMWFTECVAGKIARIPVDATPGSGAQIKEYALPNPFSYPIGIVSGPDGALWFTETNASKIGRITTNGTITEFAVPSGASSEITSAPDGALWFTEENAGKIGRILTSATTANPGIVEFDTFHGGSSMPVGITVDTNGAIWYTEYANNDFVAFW